MNEDPQEQPTPIDRPLMRSDLNEIRNIVHGISERQLTFHASVLDLTKRVADLERRVWLPVLVSTVAAVLAVLARLTP